MIFTSFNYHHSFQNFLVSRVETPYLPCSHSLFNAVSQPWSSSVCSIAMDLPSLDISYKWILWYWSCYVWLLSLGIISFPRVIHVVARRQCYFPFWVEWYSVVWMGPSLFIHSSVDGHLDCSHFLKIYCVHIWTRLSLNGSSVLSGIDLAVEFLGHRVILWLTFWGPTCFPQGLYNLYSHQHMRCWDLLQCICTNAWGICSSTSSPMLAIPPPRKKPS